MRWLDYWNSDSPIYVSERHRILHYQGIARDTKALLAELGAGRGATVLDYGCGEALSAPRVAAEVRDLVLCDGAPKVAERLRARFAGMPGIVVQSPAEVAARPPGQFDVILVNSVVQYVAPDELPPLLDQWRTALAPTGTLVLADIIPPDVSAVTDATALLKFGWSGGFAVAAMAGLLRTALSDYRSLRETLGLSRHGEADLIGLLAVHGLAGRRRRPNLGHNQARMTILATHAPSPETDASA